MYRVLLRVIRVSIHIKEKLGLTITLRKSNVFFNSPKIFYLINGTANIDDNCQLLVIESDPTFQIQVNIIYNNIKKLVGYTAVNLDKWIVNQKNHEIGILEKSPGAKAQIQFQFIYYQTDIPFKGQKILMYNSGQSQSNEEKTNRQKMELQNLNLLKKYYSLNQQKIRLQIEKKKFSLQNISKSQSFEKDVFQFNQESIKIENQKVFLNEELIKEQQKRNFLIQLIQSSGQQNLMSSFENFKIQYNSKNSQLFQKKQPSQL